MDDQQNNSTQQQGETPAVDGQENLKAPENAGSPPEQEKPKATRGKSDKAVVVEETAGRKRREPTAQEIADACEDPFLLLEAVTILANTDRFRRNNALFQIAQHFVVEQKAARDHQTRLDQRIHRKAEEHAAAAEPASE